MSEFSAETILVDCYGKAIKQSTCKGNYSLMPRFNIEMAEIPGGTAVLGSPEHEISRGDESLPYLRDLSTFHMSRHLVTQSQWMLIANLPVVDISLSPSPSHFKGDNRPVEGITYWEAEEACKRLSIAFGLMFRLPLEAEWEYACRANIWLPFHYGHTLTTALANYCGVDTEIDREEEGSYGATYAKEAVGCYRAETTAVGYFPPNGFGLFDMHGNVWEWCDYTTVDEYEEYFPEQPIRGGSWRSPPAACRSAVKMGQLPDERKNTVGFRLVCDRPD